jgi:Major Facilitator Superfamily.
MVLTAWCIAPVSPVSDTKLDIPAQLLGAFGLAVLAATLISAGRLGWFSPLVALGLLLFAVFALTFLVREHRTDAPMLPLGLFASAEFSGAVSVGFLLNVGFYGQLFLLPLYFHDSRGYSTLLTAFAILPQPGVASVASYLGGKGANHFGPASVMASGLAIGAIGFATFGWFAGASMPYSWLLIPLMAVGFGTAFTMPAATVAVMEAVPESRSGIAAGCLNAFRQIGSLVGVAAFGTIVGRTPDIVSAMRSSALIAAGLFGLGVAVSLLTRSRLPHHSNKFAE